LQILPPNYRGKSNAKKAVQNFWTYKLKELIVGKSSLRFVYNKDLKAGSIHKLWTSLYSMVSDVKKGIVKCRMLTGTYMLQKHKHKCSNGKVQADCVLCCIGDEDSVHMLNAVITSSNSQSLCTCIL
jgi:hypothetical protein